MRATIRAVLFDKDGTLFDFSATWRGAARRFLEMLAPGDPALQRRLGASVGFDADTGRFAPNSPLVAGAASEVAETLERLLPGRAAAALEAAANAAAEGIGLSTLTPATDDLPGLLDGLRARGLALGVATHDSEAAARAHLGAVGALDRFAFIAGYDSGHGLKPGPGMVLAFAEAVGVAPAEIVMVGDSAHDLGAARAAGAVAVGVLTGPAAPEDLAPLADAVLASIADLPAFLGVKVS
ncbi:MAG: HAD family hydrolase [Rhodobacteraceae bacterium]|nr:MAG: HAD family hydrolase [Paracoccaceae bacterium]